ncbi:hypothetical protein CPB85DRAFT_1561415 [Mucidula mucida]|nr:hypothetical protein CPB85DRAFT_1561415 [Mucidula mucida]
MIVGTSTRNTVYSLLEELFGSEQASTYTPVVTTRLTTMISTHEDDRALLSGFYVCSAFGWSLCTKVLLTAGAFELAQESLSSTNKDVYAQAQGVLSYYLTDTDFQELVGKDVAPLRESIIRKFVDLVFNADAAFADPVVEKLTGLEEEDKALMLSLVGDEWWKGLVWRLQFKNPDIYGAPEEWALVRQTDEKDPEPVIAAFKDILEGDKYKTEEKLDVVNGLLMSFDGIRKAAIKGGFGEFIVECVNTGDTTVVVQALVRLRGSQQTGTLVLSMDTAIEMLFKVITSPHDETRHLAYGVLTSLCDAYSTDGESLRTQAKKTISSPDRLAIVTGAFEHPDKQTAGLAATLLAEMLLIEDGSESWNYDADQGGPPPDTPFKNQLFTPVVVCQVIGLLQLSESAAGALYLLSQGCWGNQKVYNMIKEGFGAYFKDADAAFFSRLSKPCPTRHRHVKVAQAAFEAGAIEKVWSLLKQGFQTREERIDIIDVLCIFLSTEKGGDAGLLEQVRANGKVETVMIALVADESEDALQSFLWMMRILGKSGEEDEWVSAWTGLGGDDVVPHLLNMLKIGVGEVGMEEPDAEKMDRGYRLAKRKYDEAVTTAREKPDNDKYETILEVVQKITLVDGFDPKPLVTAMDEALKDATSWGKLKAWCDVGPAVGAAVVNTTAVSRLIRDISGEETEGVDPPDAVRALAAIVKAVALDNANAVKKAFFDNENAVKKALLIAGGALGEGYTADFVTGALLTLAEDYPKGLEVLASPELISVALTRFDDPDTASPESLVPLVGYACGLDPSYRKTVVEFVRGGWGEEEKKKKKTKELRMGFYDTWARMKALAKTTLEACKVLLDAGVIEAVTRVLETSDNEDDRDTVIRFLRILATSHPADGLMSSVVPVLPAMHALFLIPFKRECS